MRIFGGLLIATWLAACATLVWADIPTEPDHPQISMATHDLVNCRGKKTGGISVVCCESQRRLVP
jgi:hypothetical protein